jgi:uncharacterized protein YuzE
VKIRFSRHAKRRARLYDISDSTVTDILTNMNLGQGEEESEEKMRVHYDKEVDAIYIKLGNQKPDGVIEITEGVNLDTTSENKIVGIEILNASKKMNIKTILSYELELDKSLILKS